MNTAIAKQVQGKVRQELHVGRHMLISDVPTEEGGEGAGPSPHDLLAAALSACTALTLRLYAQRKEWPLEGAEVRVDLERAPEAARFQRKIRLTGPLDESQRARLLQVANACPVHKTLTGKIAVDTELE